MNLKRLSPSESRCAFSGSWKASSALPCIGTMNLQLVRRRRKGAAGILPAVLCTDGSAGKMPAAHWGSWKGDRNNKRASNNLRTLAEIACSVIKPLVLFVERRHGDID